MDKLLALYPEVLSLIPSSSSLSDETKLWLLLHMTIAVGETLNTNSLIQTRIVFLRKNRCLPPFDVKSTISNRTLNTISYGNSSHFMQTISLYLVKISVNVVNYCTIITWYKIVIDNCFCDGQSSKGNNSEYIWQSYYSCTLHVDSCWLILV